jgi:hypothetical protein
MRWWNIALVAAVFASCQPEPDNLKLLDDFVVSTNYDTSADFDQYSTYSIAVDTIGFISNRTNDTLLTHGESSLVRPILSRIRTNLDSRGYTRVDRNEDPDVGVNVFIVNDLNLFQQVVYSNYYYPYYYGYGSSFYYDFPYVQTYAQNTGALVVEFVDLLNRTPDNKVKVVWTATMGDLISTVDRERQSQEGIDQAFLQSPYLDR